MKLPTPGPWTYGSTGVITGADGNRVCQLLGATWENVQLIAAAPTLLDLLRRIVYTEDNVDAEVVAVLDSLGVTS